MPLYSPPGEPARVAEFIFAEIGCWDSNTFLSSGRFGAWLHPSLSNLGNVSPGLLQQPCVGLVCQAGLSTYQPHRVTGRGSFLLLVRTPGIRFLQIHVSLQKSGLGFLLLFQLLL